MVKNRTCLQNGSIEPGKPGIVLQDLPVELLEEFLSYLLHPADLLALSLTCRSLHSVIIPEHLYWHSISIPAQHLCGVAQLCGSRRHAGLVRRLIITDTWNTTGRGYCLLNTGQLKPEAEIDYELWETCAQRLTSLQSLVLHVRDAGKWAGFMKAVTGASPDLKHVVLQQYLGFMYHQRGDPNGAISAIECVRDVESFDWYSALDKGPTLFLALVQVLSRSSHTLHSIKLNISSEDTASTLFWTLRFPQLKSCQILNIHGSRRVGVFLSSHPNLEIFHLHTSSGLAFDFPPSALARARDVDIRYYGYPELYIALVQPLPNGTRRPLASLAICAQALVRPVGGKESLDVFCQHLKEVTTLRTLKWVDLSHNLSESRFLGRVAGVCTEVGEVVFAWNMPSGEYLTPIREALSHFAKLKTIRCPSSSLVPYELVCQAEVLGRACLTLQRVNDAVRFGEGWRVVKEASIYWERTMF